MQNTSCWTRPPTLHHSSILTRLSSGVFQPLTDVVPGAPHPENPIDGGGISYLWSFSVLTLYGSIMLTWLARPDMFNMTKIGPHRHTSYLSFCTPPPVVAVVTNMNYAHRLRKPLHSNLQPQIQVFYRIPGEFPKAWPGILLQGFATL